MVEKGKEEEEEEKEKEEKKEQVKEEGLMHLGIKIDPALAKMSVEDALKNEGILLYNPVEVADERTSELLGQKAGVVYGASSYALAKAFFRDDLPTDKRMRLAVKGVRPLLSMVFQGLETYNRLQTIEDSLLSGDDFETAMGRVKERRPVASARGRETSAMDVILDMEKRLRTLEDENVALKKEKEERNKKT